MFYKVRKKRLEKNLKCADVAELINVTKATYSKKEKGNIKFSLEEAKIISEKFKMPIEELFFDNKISNIETKQLNQTG